MNFRSLPLFPIGLILSILVYTSLCFTVCLMIRNFILKQKKSTNYLNLNAPDQVQEKVQIGKRTLKIGSGKGALKSFNNAYNRTIFALEEQKFEDWIDAIEKIFKMLKKDFFGTIKKFVKFLFNLGKPMQKDDFETRMQKINAQKQVLDMEKMVEKISSQPEQITLSSSSKDTTQTLKIGSNKENINIKANPLINPNKNQSMQEAVSGVKKTNLILIKKQITEDGEIKLVKETSQNINHELSVFEKAEQRILEKLATSGDGNYDIWNSLAQMYAKNNQPDKALEIYKYVSKHAQGKDKERAINQIIGL
jgi:pentatricopeptide repeat protein